MMAPAEESVGVSMDLDLNAIGRGSARGVLLTAYLSEHLNHTDKVYVSGITPINYTNSKSYLSDEKRN